MSVIGIMGGSFDPVHTGHLMLASWLLQTAGIDRLWLTLSPANPLKQGRLSASDADRLDMLRIATADSRLEVCDLELTMPRPSYTIATLRRLSELYPADSFRLIIGSDNWHIFHKWREHDAILRDYGVIIYPRPGYPVDTASLPEGATLVSAPQLEISSTMVRESIARGLDMRWWIPQDVEQYIRKKSLYGITDTQQ